MDSTVSEQELRERAEHRVKQKRQFYQGLVAYVVVNAFLVLVWWMSGAGYPWFLWVIGGWGIGVVSHGVTVFAAPESGARHERAVAAEMDRMRQQ
jgi:hypothetical protein